ncbi:alpha/beta hydrolase [Lacihabitans sp. LS3-19]|uniref:esterase/lipase family protein n=1 Tax=Lacihabitans sp. LS3-19 TaxID=2487335 RepID=UPI0020CE3E3F|nr:alpha/beta hydrolase [Lacihabitans sp. LS3-19]MCP9766391.1 alpha/beta hydrolase [Lacihabitans sp. LS3-19]
MDHIIRRPSMLLLLSEPSRALLEWGLNIPFGGFKKKEKTGDGHPVLVMPGFMSSARSTSFLRKYIAGLGYDVYDWGLGRNVGKIEFLELLIEKIDEIYTTTGEQVSLVGWSLGGVFARQVAKERPEQIRQVITLGSPFSGLTEPNNAAWLYSLITGGKKVKNVNQTFLEDLPLPAPVPTTAIYSKEDGVVPWKMCLEKNEDEIHQNIQVRGSHIGLGLNPSVLSIIENRLKQSTENWTKFKKRGLLNKYVFFPNH